jgi:uncharacterized protein (TIGR03437 family)
MLEIPLPTGTATAINVSATDLAIGNDGNLYVADLTVVRRVSPTGAAAIIGGGGSLAEGDGGPATQARLRNPTGAALDSIGNLYIADHDNNRIRRVGLDGTITTFVGTGIAGNTGDSGPAMVATLNSPNSVAFDAKGNLYIADTGNARLRMVTPGGMIYGVATAPLTAPAYLLFDSAQNLYVADAAAIFKTTPLGITTTVYGGLTSPRGMAFDSAGNFYFSQPTLKQVWMLTPSGSHSLLGTGVWSMPEGLAFDGSGNLLVADTGQSKLFSVNSFGQVTAIAGNGTPGFAGDAGLSLPAELNAPSDVLVSPSGSIYVADSGNDRIRLLTGSSSTQTTGPVLVVGAVNAASLVPGPIAPGMLMAILGTGLTAKDLAQTQVLFNSTSVPILAITATEILVRAPVSLQGTQSVQIAVNNQNVQMALIVASVVDAAPALFPAVVNQDGTLNNETNPATRGGVITLYGTGEGVTGLPFSVSIGGYDATILYAGPAGAYAGMFQVNIQLPSGYFSGGTLPIAVTVGGFAAQSSLTVMVF